MVLYWIFIVAGVVLSLLCVAGLLVITDDLTREEKKN